MKKLLLLGCAVAICVSMRAQSTITASQATYISLIAPIAIEQQQVYGIPASITTAQGILESGWGQSRLATEANNHFGIKVTPDWLGDNIEIADDKPDDKFRKYDTAEQSFVDHSLFIVGRSRYASLFQLDTMDYEGWAKGLQAAGYATDQSYATNLIGVIERYGLDRLDSETIPKEYQLTTTQPSTDAINHYGTLRRTGRKVTGVDNVSELLQVENAGQPQQVVQNQNTQQPQTTAQQQPQTAPQQSRYQPQQPAPSDDGLVHYRVGRLSGRRYITAQRGDTYGVLARMLGISEAKLRQYNNSPEAQPRSGDYVFIQKDKNAPAPVQ